jgi:CRISPR-associated protein Cmr3
MMFFRIIPLDTLFFRAGKPFTAGEDTYAEIVFPPYPSVLYGAIRSFAIAQRGKLSALYNGGYPDIGTDKTKGTLSIKGPFVVKEGIICLPAPLDSVKTEDGLRSLELSKDNAISVSDYPMPYILKYREDKKVEPPDGLFIDAISFKDYLKGKRKRFNPVKDIYMIEPKISIKRERRTTEEGFLCRIPFIRMETDTSLVCEINGISELANEGILKLGGEGKGARFEEIIDDPLKSIKELKLDFSNKLFKLYLATPAIFNKGWLPHWIDEDTLEGEFGGIKLKLLTAAIGKPVPIGGWDMANNRPKPMRKAVPAGSVYYFEVVQNVSSEKLKECFHLKSISDLNPEEGFGVSILGEVVI